MNNRTIWYVLVLGVVSAAFFMPEIALAQFGGGFEGRMEGLTQSLTTVVLPLVSILGLVYAAILAVTGDGAAKGRIILVIGCSIIGFLAPHIIRWIQAASGG